ncbi:MAG: ABC transporter permease subunit, partial [Polaromonas sp.]|nr:ABC transporter permease subunit [Polaromonas sp.]
MSEHSLIPPRAAPSARRKVFSWRSKQARAVVYQVLAVGMIVFLVWLLVSNTMANMKTRGIQSGFDFLMQPAGFDIGEGWLSYDSIDPYWKAFLVGLVNTLRVAVVGIVLTSILGTLLGVGRFSRNALVRGLCYGYVELFRNIPVLLQLLMWYLLFTEYLPAIDQALHLGKLVYVSKNGLSYPVPVWQTGHTLAVFGALAGLIAGLLYARSARRAFDLTGKARPVLWVSAGMVVAGAIIGWLAGGAPSEWNVPQMTEVQVEGGGA